jgi:beta-alanine--pyruvate transaminase
MMTTSTANLVDDLASKTPNNLDALWMPFTANRQFKANPRLLVSAEGMHYRSVDGREILDATAGLWCVNAGHGRREIVEAVQNQAERMDYAPSFQMAHPLQFELAARLTAMLPGDLDHAFFTNSGSESVDTALKIALAYHQAKGDAGRTRLIGRERGYHGVGFGGMSVGGIGNNRRQFRNQLPEVDHLPHTHSLEHNAFSRGQPEWGAHLADELTSLVQLHGADTIAAVIVEPMAASTGVLIPPMGYLRRLREICDQHGILLIFDEVITGFGRLGASFACELFDVVPDIVTMAKGLTNATVPMGAVGVRKGIHDALMNGPEHLIELFHGYTYSGHPLACAAGLAAIDVYRQDELFERAAALAPYWEDAVHSLRDRRNVIDLRNLGLVAGIELESRPGEPTKRAYDAFVRCFEEGVLVRTTGDIIALSPPLIVERAHIDRIVGVIGDTLDQVA